MGVGLLPILMSWGGYFLPFNSFLLKYLPMYNKFRAPSMILVVPTFLFCMIAVLALQKIVQTEDRSALWRPYKWSMLAMAGVFLLLGLLYFRFDYAGIWEAGLLKKASVLGGEALTSMQVFVQGLR